MTSLLFIILAALLFIPLSLYAALYAFASLRFLALPSEFKDQSKVAENHESQPERITVLVPALNEGQGLLECAQSILAQEYEGQIDIVLLVADLSDSALPFLTKAYPDFLENDQEMRLVDVSGRSLSLLFCGCSAKWEKINFYLDTAEQEADFIAFLDADHRAELDWIDNALDTLRSTHHIGVQARRAPLETRGVFQVWDSFENHLGNELINSVADSFELPIFFTGTTAIFRKEAFADGFRFNESLTEDTDLSYRLLANRRTLCYERSIGSREELAPNLATFISRRRRWAYGHTTAFFTHLTRTLSAPLTSRSKIHFLIHGGFFFLSPIALALFSLFSLYLFLQLQASLQSLALLTSAAAASILPFFGQLYRRGAASALLASFLLVFPHVVALLLLILSFIRPDIPSSLLSFPFIRRLDLWLLFLWLAPPVVLLVCSLRLKINPAPNRLLIVLLYPLVLPITFLSHLLGFADLAFKRSTWISSTRLHNASPSGRWIPAYTTLPVLLCISCSVVVALGIRNDLQLRSSCGNHWSLSPSSYVLGIPTSADLTFEKERQGDDTVQITSTVQIHQPRSSDYWTQLFFDGLPIQTQPCEAKSTSCFIARSKVPIDTWERHLVRAEIYSDTHRCEFEQSTHGIIKRLTPDALLVNGEPFLIKGVIPSFTESQHQLSPEQGIRLLRESGANAVRYYRPTSLAERQALTQNQLFFVTQPYRSAWDESDISTDASRLRFVRRLQILHEQEAGAPYLLFHNVGNELEIEWVKDLNDPTPINEAKKLITEAQSTLREKIARSGNLPLSYSSFLQFPNFEVDIYGLVANDTGDLKWRHILELLERNKPYAYISELGGVVAPYEMVHPYIRGLRFQYQWGRVLEQGLLGAFFFQSHDNWAQPIWDIINDPFSPDQPDDLRGFWTRENEPKFILRTLKHLFSDIQVESIVQTSENEVSLRLRNLRPYTIEHITLGSEVDSSSQKTLIPHEEKTFLFQMKEGDLPQYLHAITHGGASSLSLFPSLDLSSKRPQILNWDYVPNGSSDGLLGELPYSNFLQVWSPQALVATLNSKRISLSRGENRIPLRAAPTQPATNVVVEQRGKAATFSKGMPLKPGPTVMRFQFPESFAGNLPHLFLEGMNTVSISVRFPGQDHFREFRQEQRLAVYQEFAIDLSEDFDSLDKQGYFEVRFNRRENVPESFPEADLGLPRFYSSTPVELSVAEGNPESEGD